MKNEGFELMDNRPIGIFDSGLGGLTAVKALKDILPYENDIAYEWCVNIAKDFEISDFNVNTRGLVECLEDYLRANIYKDENNIWSFRKADLYEVCGGVRGVKYDNFE